MSDYLLLVVFVILVDKMKIGHIVVTSSQVDKMKIGHIFVTSSHVDKCDHYALSQL